MMPSISTRIAAALSNECSRTGLSIVAPQINFDDSVFTTFEFDGKDYSVKIDGSKEDPAVVAKVHCEGVGLNEEQCAMLAEMLAQLVGE